MKRVYFKRLFLAFLLAAILPICLCVIAISYGSFRMSRERYRDKARDMAAVSSENIREVLAEYEQIIDSLARDPALLSCLESGSRRELEDLVRPLQTGRDNRIKIRVVNLKNQSIYPDSRDAGFYIITLYNLQVNTCRIF